jgi:bla regulator protein BlaR1
MNFSELILPEWMSALGWTVLHSLWQGALIATGVAIIFALLPRLSSPVRYRLAVAALLGMAASTCWTLVAEFQSLSASQVSISSSVSASGSLIIAEESTYLSEGWWGSWFPQMETFTPWIAGFWLLGALLFGVRWLGGLFYLQRLRRHSQVISGGRWAAKFRQLAQELGINRPLSLRLSHEVASPMVIGHLKPMVLLPVGLISGLNPEQVEAILVHELAHVRRFDYLVNALQTFLETIFFFHPAYWWLSQIIRDEREHCCDDLAIAHCGDAMVYARALTELEQQRLESNPFALGLQGRPNHLLSRIKRVMGVQHPQPNLSLRGIAFLLVGLGLWGLSSTEIAQAQTPPVPLTWEAPALAPAASVENMPRLASIPAPEQDPLPQAVAAPFTTQVDSPPPAPPAPHRVPAPPAPPPPPPPPPPPLPDLSQFPAFPLNPSEEGAPDYLTEEEAGAMQEHRQAMKELKEKMARYQQDIKQWQAQYEQTYAKEMKDFARESARFAEQWSEEHQEQLQKELKRVEEWAKTGELEELAARALRFQSEESKRQQMDASRNARERFRNQAERKREEAERLRDREISEQERMMREEAEDAMQAERTLREEERALRIKEAELREQAVMLRAQGEELREKYQQAKAEMIKDGLIRSQTDKVRINIKKGKMEVNGKKLNEKLRKKYLRILDIEDTEDYEYNYRINY